MSETLAILVHAESGSGKSWLGQTAPAPRLVLDAESGGSRFARVVDPKTGKVSRPKSITWDPHSEAPPAAGDWDTCFVSVKQFGTLQRTFEWLNIGDHPFRSIILDSLTEIQDICKNDIRTGDEVMNERMWGILLDRMTSLVKSFRDLRAHPKRPIETILILALTGDIKGKFQPLVQGQLRDKLPGWMDAIGYLVSASTPEGDYEGRMLIQPDERYLAKDRTHVLKEHYGRVVVNPNITQMLGVLNTEEN